MRGYPHKPNRARRAQSAHALNCGYVPNRGDGARWRICYQWPKATMRRQGRRETPACEVYPNRRRAFWAPLTAPWSGQGQARAAGAVRAPRTLRVRGVGSHARVSPAAPAMPDTYSVCVAAPYALFSGHTPLSDTQAQTRSWLSEPQSSPLVILDKGGKIDLPDRCSILFLRPRQTRQ